MYVSQTTPQVTAWGFFDVGKALIPTVHTILNLINILEGIKTITRSACLTIQLVGTTLTYLLIIIQFYAAEKE